MQVVLLERLVLSVRLDTADPDLVSPALMLSLAPSSLWGVPFSPRQVDNHTMSQRTAPLEVLQDSISRHLVLGTIPVSATLLGSWNGSVVSRRVSISSIQISTRHLFTFRIVTSRRVILDWDIIATIYLRMTFAWVCSYGDVNSMSSTWSCAFRRRGYHIRVNHKQYNFRDACAASAANLTIFDFRSRELGL